MLLLPLFGKLLLPLEPRYTALFLLLAGLLCDFLAFTSTLHSFLPLRKDVRVERHVAIEAVRWKLC